MNFFILIEICIWFSNFVFGCLLDELSLLKIYWRLRLCIVVFIYDQFLVCMQGLVKLSVGLQFELGEELYVFFSDFVIYKIYFFVNLWFN